MVALQVIRRRLRDRARTVLEPKGLWPKGVKQMCETAVARELQRSAPRNVSQHEIDHVLPLAAFNLYDPRERAAAFHPENHCWLPKQVNRSKGAQVDDYELEQYLARHGVVR